MSSLVDELEVREDVTGWRLDQLERGGYPSELAKTVAERWDVDLHEAIDLVKRGCSPELAAEILL